MKGEENSRGFATKAIHAGQDPAKWSSRAVIPPIFTSTTYAQIEPGKLYPDGFEYSRGGNPTRNATEECIAALENGKYGLIFSSGLAALSAITHILPTNSHILSNDDIYGGSNRLFRLLKKTCNVKTTYFDSDLDNIESLIKENTKMLYIESPTNPLLKVCDIEKLSKIAKSHNLIFAVDSTFATPVNQKPLDLGADIVYHSGSKFLNGISKRHTDVIMGICVTNDDDIYQKLRFNQYAIGSVSSPFDCYLMNRGLKTLKLRMLQHNKNAMTVAQFLENHPNVESVNYPGLKSHKSYEISKKQMNGFGGVVSFYLK
ncbi:hypothetical protein A3Q56_05106, partial [Intoshia linei]